MRKKTMFELEQDEIRKKRSWIYRSPLSKKKQLVSSKAEANGKVKIYNEEELFLHKLKNAPRTLI